MNAAKQAGWLFCVLVALACSGLYFASSPPIARLDDKTLSMTFDTLISKLTVRQFDANGKVANFMQTPEVKHIPGNNTHFCKSPKIMIAQPDQPAWEISAKQAQAINNGERINFIHDVLIHQNKSEHTQESTMKTEKLTYFPKEKLASTELAVRFVQPGSVVQALGMKAYLAEKRIQLLRQTQATYVPKHA
jgi:lipopolysaccharide export system protein LptC